MLPACFRLADEVFPRVRADAARRLAAAGWSQGQTAAALGVSQAMVSKYVAAPAPAAAMPARGSAPHDALVARLAEDLVATLQSDGAGAAARAGEPGPWCRVLARDTGGEEALTDLLAAEARLRARPPLRVMPQIGLNLVRATAGATTEAAVLGYPARLVAVGQRLLTPAPPALGGSGHLARALLWLRRDDPAVQAMANIRGGQDVAHAVRRAGLHLRAQPAGGDATDADRRFRLLAAAPPARAAPAAARPRARKAAAPAPRQEEATLRAYHDPGAVGLEACVYIAGPDAGAVADAVLRIDSLVNP